MDKIKYSIVIPCYNEENAIKSTIQEISQALVSHPQFELVVVNDGSTDNTLNRLQSLIEDHDNLRIINHEFNRGYGASLKTGINQAKGKFIAIIDADGSYPIDQLPILLDAIKDNDMVVGARISKDVVYPWIRKIPKIFLTRYASWLAGITIPDLNSGLRVFRRKTYKQYRHLLPDGFSFTTTITMAMITNGHKVEYLPITYYARIGKSKIRPLRDTLNFLQLIIRMGMYFAPLRVFLPVAGIIFIAALFSLYYDIFLIQNLTDKTIILLMFWLNTCMFALLADMIDKRN